MRRSRWRVAGIILLALVLTDTASSLLLGFGVIHDLVESRPYKYREVVPGVLYRDGMREPHQFIHSCRDGHIKTVVSVIGRNEALSERFAPAFDECHKLGIRTECLNVSYDAWPDTQAIQHFLEIATDPGRQPVLVHCREGVRRTGMMVAAYQMSVLGYSREQAKAAIELFDHSSRVGTDLQKFIDLYDPATRSVIYDESYRVGGLEPE